MGSTILVPLGLSIFTPLAVAWLLAVATALIRSLRRNQTGFHHDGGLDAD